LYWRTLTSSEYFNRTPRKNMYMYSFAQYPLSWWPSGSANLSRIDNTTLEFTMPTLDADGNAFGEADVTVIAENFNVVRVQGGMMAKDREEWETLCLLLLQLLAVKQAKALPNITGSGKPLRASCASSIVKTMVTNSGNTTSLICT